MAVILPGGHCGGRLPHTEDKRDLKFQTYRVPGVPLPIPPTEFGHESDVPADEWLMLGNGPDDTVFPGFQGAGCCTLSSGGHQTMLWTAEGFGTPVFITGANTISDYTALTGYDPKTGQNDTGCEIRDVLSYRQKTGLIDAAGNRHKIGAYLALDLANLEAEVDESLYLFGVVELGVNLPVSAEAQFDANNEPWIPVAGSDIAGGHDVPLVARRQYRICVTWKKLQGMDLAFLLQYTEEAWAIVSVEALNGQGKSPEGFDYEQLLQDLSEIPGVTPDPVPATGNTASVTLDLNIAAAPLAITTTNLPDNTQGLAYDYTLEAAGGTAPYTWSISGLPEGLVGKANGEIAGVPVSSGTYPISISVTDSSDQIASITLPLVIEPGVPALAITTASLPAGQVGAAYSATVEATGGVAPYTWSATGLPAGLSIDPAAGMISGAPTAAGDAQVTITVTDSSGNSAGVA